MKLFIIAACLAFANAQNDFLYAFSDDCGGASYGAPDWHIIGGQEATPYDYPWMVSVQYSSHFCGGSIIDSTTILTAAHCLLGVPDGLYVSVGEHDLGDSSDGDRISVSKVTNHPGYDDSTSDNDIALLELSSAITFGADRYPICAPDPNNDNTGDDSIVAGWGNINPDGPGDYPDELYYVEVPIISNAECKEDYGSSAITDQMICAGIRDSQDACQGDSGGPLWVDVSGVPSVVGIVSWGSGCADGYPGVYARVNQFIDWVNSNK